MHVLSKIVSDFEGSSVEVISASEDIQALKRLKSILDLHLESDINFLNTFNNHLYPLFLEQNPRPPANLDATETEKNALLSWIQKNTEFVKGTLNSQELYNKDVPLSVLSNTYYEIIEVESPDSIIEKMQ